MERVALAEIPLMRSRSSSASEVVTDRGFARHAAWALVAAGVLMLLGSLVDLGVLWGLQRQDNVRWEFVALSSTAEGFPRMALGIGLLYAAIWVAAVRTMWAWRSLALFLVALGVAAGLLGALMVTDYFALIGQIPVETRQAFRSSVAKSLTLYGLYVIVMLPIGILLVRRPGTS